MLRERPLPPYPGLARRPEGPFGWLEARLLHERWLARLGVDATAVLVLLALAADPHGASHFGRARMTQALRLERRALDRALERLRDFGLVAHRPWRTGHADGVWQLLALPPPPVDPEGSPPVRPLPQHRGSLAAILQSLGLPRPDG